MTFTAENFNFLENLDADQLRAVTSGSKYLLVAAAPGSGKTRVLSARFIRLISGGVSAESLLAVTFTNRAAKEMKERIEGFTGLPARGFDIATFHGYSLKLLKRLRDPFSLYGRADTLRLLKELGVNNPSSTAERISSIKNGLLTPSEEDRENLLAYNEKLKETGALDLDDLVPEAIKAAEAGIPEDLRKSHIMVDEYQDINPEQARLAGLLAGKSASVLAIGDPDQAIYSFRGSNPKSFMEFEKEYPGTEVITLTKNYRSAGKIVFASSRLIENNRLRIKKDSKPVKSGGEIKHVECADERAEAEFIIKEIERMMGGLNNLTAGDTDLNFSDFAVLSRTNRQADSLAESFSRSSVPYYTAQDEGPGFGDFLRRLMERKASKEATLADLIKEEAKPFGIKEDLLNIFLNAAKGYEGRLAVDSLEEYLEEVILMEPSDHLDIKADRVNLLTLHVAKGLEFKVVFIAGVEEGVIPMVKGGEDEIEEERRLFYVGMTRAMEKLYILSAKTRRLWGGIREAAPSRFLKEIPEGLVERELVEKKKVKKRPVQKGLFE